MPPRLQENSPRAGFFEADQLAAVLRYLPEYLHGPMTFAYLTGWRRSEILRLPWRNVDFAAETVRLDVGATKNKDGRVIYMTAPLRQLLETHWQRTLVVQRESGCIVALVFHRNGKPMLTPCGKPIQDYYRAWQRACRAAGVPGKIPHDFRRTAVRNIVRAGIPERVAMQLTGHRTRSVFDRYNIVSDGDLRDAARKLETALSKQGVLR